MVSMNTLKGAGAQQLQKPTMWWKGMEYMQVAIRLICLAGSTAALACMVTARQSGNLEFYGFKLPLRSNWSFSLSFRYLVGISGLAIAHSFFLLLFGTFRVLRKSPVIPSRSYAWFAFAADQVHHQHVLNRTGVEHTALPNFCKPLGTFCNHVAASIAFTFLSSFLLAASAIVEVIWLSQPAG